MFALSPPTEWIAVSAFFFVICFLWRGVIDFCCPFFFSSMDRLQETICSQADRVVAASMSELSPTNDAGGRAMVTAQGVLMPPVPQFVARSY